MPQTSSESDQDRDTQISSLRGEIAVLRRRLANLEKTALRLDEIFQPAVGFLAACLATIGFALACIVYLRGDEQYWYLSYIVPIGFPFVGFVFDRMDRFFSEPRGGWKQTSVYITDLAVVILATARAFTPIPFISGHALFLTYALLTVKSRWVRIPAAVVLLQVIYFKVFMWSDMTVVGGIGLGLAAAGLAKYLHTRK
jgi:hypothetical protein